MSHDSSSSSSLRQKESKLFLFYVKRPSWLSSSLREPAACSQTRIIVQAKRNFIHSRHQNQSNVHLQTPSTSSECKNTFLGGNLLRWFCHSVTIFPWSAITVICHFCWKKLNKKLIDCGVWLQPWPQCANYAPVGPPRPGPVLFSGLGAQSALP